MDIFEKARGFLLEPSNAFESSKYDTVEAALKYYVVVSATFSALFAVMIAFISARISSTIGVFIKVPGTGIADIFSNFILLLILMISGVFVWSAILHIFLYAMGERKEISRTIKAVMYGSTPIALLGWIPLLGIIGWIWAWVLHIVGIKFNQDIMTGKAISVVLAPIIIFFILALMIIAAVASFVVGLLKSTV
jgi:hypothetical protein